ncbi:unnamed protein product [Protopolystoma xenopodis]|uniref:Uncharacterized protein n=1 Tax=Protopolystoma xenopodis TaxID=117903 RepID=A0A3S5AAN7_9PLAT|nr:unnamed protein product [Protopolystoma xenopodis]
MALLVSSLSPDTVWPPAQQLHTWGAITVCFRIIARNVYAFANWPWRSDCTRLAVDILNLLALTYPLAENIAATDVYSFPEWSGDPSNSVVTLATSSGTSGVDGGEEVIVTGAGVSNGESGNAAAVFRAADFLLRAFHAGTASDDDLTSAQRDPDRIGEEEEYDDEVGREITASRSESSVATVSASNGSEDNTPRPVGTVASVSAGQTARRPRQHTRGVELAVHRFRPSTGLRALAGLTAPTLEIVEATRSNRNVIGARRLAELPGQSVPGGEDTVGTSSLGSTLSALNPNASTNSDARVNGLQ